MPEVLGDPPSPRTALFWNGTAWQWGLVHTSGRLQVRGEDQLFSFAGPLRLVYVGIPSMAGGYVTLGPVPAGEIWCVTTVAARNQSAGLTRVDLSVFSGAVDYVFYDEVAAIVQWEFVAWGGHVWIVEDDVIRAELVGSGAADVCEIALTGYIMTLEV